MLKRLILAATLLASASAVHAEPSYTFTGGGSSPASGLTVVYDFDDQPNPASLVLGPLVQIKSPPADGDGAPPQFADPGGDYLSVLNGGLATITFDTAVGAFSFDWGSVDSYNTLTVFGSFGSLELTGSDVSGTANGDQSAAATNGLFTFRGNGDTITGFSLASSGNSFEIDNVAIGAIPEPASWAMMILGVGAIGGALRRRSAVRTSVSFA